MLDDLDTPIFGVDAISRALNLSKRQTYHALEQGHLPAGKLGRRWFTTRRRLLNFLNGEAKLDAAA
jgi:hypothetical protein